MNSSSGLTKSVWQTTVSGIDASGLAQDGAHFDVCVVGAGISGLSAAYNLAREGKSVLVIDDGPIAGGETAHTTAHLSNVIDDGYVYIEKNHGESGARLARESHGAAIDFIENAAKSENIDCEFERLDGYLFLAEGENTDELDEESAAMLRAGLEHEKLACLELAGFSSGGAALRIPNQGQFHPLKYLAGIARAIEQQGGKLVASTRVTQIDDGKDGASARVHFAGGSVTAKAIIVATNSPFNDRVAMHTKQSAYRTFVIGVRVEENLVPHALIWDNLDPYHYVRTTRDESGAVLIIGGEDHKTGQEDDGIDRFARLEAWGKQHFSAIGETIFRWSGQVLEPSDGLAFIGKNPGDESVYIATGDSGMGMTHGTIAGILLCELVCGRDNSWSELYEPSRQMTHSAGDFAKENLNVVAQFADWVKGGDVKSSDEIAAGEGAVLRRGLTKVAAYRDESGALHERSAVCPHLGCIVSWNSLEKSWDCPCHGSRFDATGCVLNGPANRDLGEVESENAS